MQNASASKHPWTRLWPVLLLPTLALGFWALNRRSESARDAPATAATWPRMPDFALPRILPDGTLTSQLVGSATYAGRPYVLGFWASWCLACQDEAPEMAALSARLHAAGIPLVMVATSDEVGAAARTGHANLDQPPLLSDADGAFAQRQLHMDSLPQTLVIDAVGAIRFRYEQRLSPEASEQVFKTALAATEAARLATRVVPGRAP